MNSNSVYFQKTIHKYGLNLKRHPLKILQVNVGKHCNQACHHCHVEAGPKRTEIMEKKTVDQILKHLRSAHEVRTVDLTGGAPELNPHFRYFVKEIRALGKEVIDRCNLTVFFEKNQEDTASFLSEHRVHIIASLPCYSKDNVEKQRGIGVFDKSLKALLLLNELGYGKGGSDLKLDLVYNPLGAFLPPTQTTLERDYKTELKELFSIEFNSLYTITNMPIKRFLQQLERAGQVQTYMDLLIQSFNPQAALGIMCRELVSIGWDGQIYDCDFNQMLEIPIGWKHQTIWSIESLYDLTSQEIAFADHCFGCTAGAGSSCGGSLVKNGKKRFGY